jgi:GNAT superfamily N-acetyltransferase
MSEPKFTIKKVDIRNAAHQSAILFLQRKTLPEDVPYKPDHGHWWIAYDESGKPVGFGGLVRSIQFSDTGYLCRAGVLGGYTGHGLQKRLIEVRLRKAKELGWNWLITDTTDNPASSNSLINCGFKLYEPSSPWAFKNSLYWKRKIDQDAVQRRGSKKKKACAVLP